MDGMKTLDQCPCGRPANYVKVGLCKKCYLAQWKRSPRGKAVIALNRLKHATEWNATRRAERAANPGTHSENVKAYHRRLRTLVVEGLGGRCACCGEREIKFLQLDHINGGGNKHYKKFAGSWAAVYRAVRDTGFPRDQYRLLCANCNSAISLHDICPHEIARRRAQLDFVVNDQ